jgi:hypothetical protein
MRLITLPYMGDFGALVWDPAEIPADHILQGISPAYWREATVH